MTEPAFPQDLFSTTDPDRGHDYLRRNFADIGVRISGSADHFSFGAHQIGIGNAFITHLRHTMSVGLDVPDGVGWPAFYTSHRPSVEVSVDHALHRLDAGQSMTFSPGPAYQVAWQHLDADVVGLDPAVLDDHASVLLDPGLPLRFDFATAVSPTAADHWRCTVRLARQVALSNVGNPDGALLADQLGRLLATAALTCFPNTTMTDSRAAHRRSSPASLRRAVAYIEAHLDQPLALGEIAAAACVSPRALNLTFHRHLDTTPMGYVRRARLDRAHHDLQTAQPGDGATVTGIASRWGFYSLPRFGVTYRRTYGQPPSHTLRC